MIQASWVFQGPAERRSVVTFKLDATKTINEPCVESRALGLAGEDESVRQSGFFFFTLFLPAAKLLLFLSGQPAASLHVLLLLF